MTEQLEIPADHFQTGVSESTKKVVLEQPNLVKEVPHPSPESPVSSAIATEDPHSENVPDKPPGPLALATVPDTEVSVGSPAVPSYIVGGGSHDRDRALAILVNEKTLAQIRAWEENKKAKAQNKFHRAVAEITAWENIQKAKAEARMKTAAEKLERKKAALVKKMMDEIANAHKKAEYRKVMAEAKMRKEILKLEEIAAKHRASGTVPKKFLCFSA